FTIFINGADACAITRNYASQQARSSRPRQASGELENVEANEAKLRRDYKSESTETEEYRIALFLHCIGPDALRIYNGFDFATEEEQKSLENVIQKFDQYAIGELNETYERFQFNDRNQKPDNETDESDVEIVSGVSELCDSINLRRDAD
ncbi:hypothetical protein QZH41_010774, partial [Actinostola sp. cb2023]